MGIQTGFITGRRSPAVARRAEVLKVTFVYLGQAKKMQAFAECVEKAGVTNEEVAYMGDDLPDIPLAQCAGVLIHNDLTASPRWQGPLVLLVA